MCTLYHASNKFWQVGERWGIEMFEGEETYDHENRPPEEKEVNDLLDQSKPLEVVVSRKKCIYLFGDLRQCKEYAQKGNIAHIYEVKPDDLFGPYPMVLVNRCMREPDNEDIRDEYWHPTQHWKYMEFLTSSFTIISEIPSGRTVIMNADYTDDIMLARRIFGE